MRVASGTHRGRAALGVAVVFVAGLAVVAAPPAETAASGKPVAVVLDEWKLVPARGTVPAGKITFVVRNGGTMIHQLVVLKHSRRAGALPLKAGKAVETGRLGGIKQIPSGASKQLTLTLRPGRYVLLCNLMGHYQAGQFAALQVR
ncbi:MAG: cupredoxin domain-containing protein [Gaiellaceae bacterium]